MEKERPKLFARAGTSSDEREATALIEYDIKKTLEKMKKCRFEEEVREIDNSKLTGLDVLETLNTIQKESDLIMEKLFKLLLSGNIRANRILHSYFGNLLVVTQQPPRVVEYKKEYSTTVRFLVGNNFLYDLRIQDTSKLSLQAFCVTDEVERTNAIIPYLDTFHPIAVSQFIPETVGDNLTTLVTTVRFQITPKMIRGKRKVDENEKTTNIDSFRICFSLVLGFNGIKDGLLEAFTTSYPLKVVMNKKEPILIGSDVKSNEIWISPMEDLIWRNAMGNLEDVAGLQGELPLTHVNQAIKTKFQDFTGRELLDQDLFVIQQKFFSPEYVEKSKSEKSLTISYAQFMKSITFRENENKTTLITYWGWFYYLAKFISEHLQVEEKGGFHKVSFWKDGFVNGYITTQEAQDKLKDSDPGTFLLRFSNSVPNAVTIDWKEIEGIYSYRGTPEELRLRNIVDRIMDIKRWKYFYPNTEKESVLLKYVANIEAPQSSPEHELNGKKGYVTARLKSHLEIDPPE